VAVITLDERNGSYGFWALLNDPGKCSVQRLRGMAIRAAAGVLGSPTAGWAGSRMRTRASGGAS
jgi:hypothetical protein